MSEPPQALAVPRRGVGALGVVLRLYALSAFAVAQPVYSLLAENAEFFVAHGATALDLVLLALLLSGVVPWIPIALAWRGGLAARRLTAASAAPVVGLLAALIALPPLNRLHPPSSLGALAAAAALGTAAGWLYWRCRTVRGYLTALSPAAVIFPLWFLLATPVSNLVWPDSVEAGRGAALEVTTPVVIVVFDELPVASLVNADDVIDRRLYPNFAALADTATWYRNAATVATNTTYSVPALLTGRRPTRSRLPTAAEYPNNLLRTLSSGGYELRVFETQTALCDEDLCSGDRPTLDAGARRLAMLSDIGVLYAHLIVPRPLARRLPAVDASWRDFAAPRSRPESTPAEAYPLDPLALFERFLEAIDSGRRSTVYFAHLGLPHVPWKRLPSGREYGPVNLPILPHGIEDSRWVGSDFELAQAYQRHLFQVVLADRLLGRLVARLEAAGLFEEALLVVVADHGSSFAPGDLRRALSSSNLGDIVNVPLLVKLPGQRTGVVSDRRAETIDVVATIADQLAVELPWRLDGSSLLSPAAGDRNAVRATEQARLGELVEYSPEVFIRLRAQSVARRLALFPDSSSWRSLFDIGPRISELRGRALDQFVVGETPSSELEVLLDQPEQWVAVRPQGRYVPAHVTGRLVGSAARRDIPLAVAINGAVQASTWSHATPTGEVRFTALLPEAVLVEGNNPLALLRLDLAAADARAHLLSTRELASARLVAAPSGDLLVMPDGRRLPLVTDGVRARAWIQPAAQGPSLIGGVRLGGSALSVDRLVVTLGGQPLFSASLEQVLRPANGNGPQDLVRFRVQLPDHAADPDADLRVFIVIGDRAQAVRMLPQPPPAGPRPRAPRPAPGPDR